MSQLLLTTISTVACVSICSIALATPTGTTARSPTPTMNADQSGCAIINYYDVGPQQTYAALGQLPWSKLKGCDTVRIFPKPNSGTYNEMILISAGTDVAPTAPNQFMRVIGMPDPLTGALPIIDGTNATQMETLPGQAPRSLRYHDNNNPQAQRALYHLGLVMVGPQLGYNYNNGPAGYIGIENLDIRNVQYNAPFTDGKTGLADVYNSFGSCLFVEAAAHLVIKNNILHGCGNGLFINSKNDIIVELSQDILIEGNWIYNNSNPPIPNVSNGFHEHNSYTEARDIIFQYNTFGDVRPGAFGDCLKDRSSGTIIRYNIFTSNCTILLNLLNSTGSPAFIAADAGYGNDYVYGNLFDVAPSGSRNANLVTYGGDTGVYSSYRQKTLRFYNNTVVVKGDAVATVGYAETYLFNLLMQVSVADVQNNIFYAPSITPNKPGKLQAMSIGIGTVNLANNWVGPNTGQFWLGHKLPGVVVNGWNTNIGANNMPAFVNEAAHDYRPTALSPLTNAGSILANLNVLSLVSPTPPSVIPKSAARRLGALDIGAYEATFAPVLATQTIMFNPSPPASLLTTAGSFTVSASGGGSNNPVTFASNSVGICTTSGINGALVTLTGVAGTCIVRANQLGNANYAAAAFVDGVIVVASITPPSTFTIAPSAGANGTISPNAAQIVASGATSVFTVLPNAGFTAAVGGTCGGSMVGTTYTTNAVAANCTVIASFAAILPGPFTVTPSAGANGTISPNASQIVASGATSVFTVTPNTGFTASVGGTCGGTLVGSSYTTNAVALSCTVTASFAASLPPPALTPPTAPTNLACAIATGTDVNCSFTGSQAVSGVTLAGYQLICSDPVGNALSRTFSGLTILLQTVPTERIYTCQALALSTVGPSLPSASARFIVHTIPISKRQMVDVDGDGFADILIHPPATVGNNTPNPAVGLQVGRWNGSAISFTPVLDLGAGWDILGLGDFTGIGKTGIVSRDAAGQVRFDLSIPTVGATIPRSTKLDWTVEAVGDFDGDGKSDILWRYLKPGTNDSGVTFAWFMEGATLISTANVNVNEVKHRGGAPLSWNLVGTTDLDADGLADIVWVSPANDIRALMGKGGRTWSNQKIGIVPPGYVLFKLGDINGDGKGDLLFRNAQGNVKAWLMDGITVLAEIDLPTTQADWTFFASGDFDGNNTMDIVWQKSDGTLVVWLMNSNAPTAPSIFNNAGAVPTGYVNVEP